MESNKRPELRIHQIVISFYIGFINSALERKSKYFMSVAYFLYKTLCIFIHGIFWKTVNRRDLKQTTFHGWDLEVSLFTFFGVLINNNN